MFIVNERPAKIVLRAILLFKQLQEPAVELSPDFVQQVFALPATQRFELAQQLLDSIDDDAAAALDEEFLSEIRRRREEMLRGEQTISDWRAALSRIERDLQSRKQA